MTNLLSRRLPKVALPAKFARVRQTVQGWRSAPQLGKRHWRESLERLRTAANPLRAFSQLSDREFAALATSLGDYQGQTETLTAATRTLQELFSEGDQDNALQRALSLGKHAIELVHSSFGIAHSLQSQFDRVSATLDEALTARARFEENMVVFRSLSIGFRIEAARCDAEHKSIFTAVADDFGSLERQVSQSTAEAFTEIEKLTTASPGGGHSTRQDRDAFHRESRRQVETLRKHLDGMEAAIGPCADEVQKTVELLQEMPLHLAGVVQNLQYQDIVRQKLEHVEEGLELLNSPKNRTRRLFGQVCSVQKAQLTAAREQIQSAGSRLLEGIDAIAGIGEETAGRIHALERTALEDLGSRELAKCLSEDLAQLAKVAQTTEKAHQHIAAHVDQIEQVVRVFTEKIASQQNAVRLAALNAQVAAARLSNGGALEKLAQETSRIAKANAVATEALREKLIETLTLLQNVRGDAATSLEVMDQEKQTLEHGVATIEAEMNTFADRIEADTREVSQAFSKSHQALESLRRSVTFPSHLDDAFNPLAAALSAFATTSSTDDATQAESFCPHTEDLLAQHAARYTMDEERMTHDSALQSAPSVPAPALAKPASESSPEGKSTPAPAPPEDDDDGIELF